MSSGGGADSGSPDSDSSGSAGSGSGPGSASCSDRPAAASPTAAGVTGFVANVAFDKFCGYFTSTTSADQIVVSQCSGGLLCISPGCPAGQQFQTTSVARNFKAPNGDELTFTEAETTVTMKTGTPEAPATSIWRRIDPPPEAARPAAAEGPAAAETPAGESPGLEKTPVRKVRVESKRQSMLDMPKEEALSEISPDGVIMESFLFKLAGSGRKKWDKRWFKLTGRNLDYSQDRGTVVKGSIDVSSISGVNINTTQGKPNCMEIITPDRIYYAYAEAGSVNSRDAWIRSIRLAMDWWADLRTRDWTYRAKILGEQCLLIEGPLSKRADTGTSFKQRHCAVSRHWLTLFEKRGKPSVATINLDSMRQMKVMADKDGTFCFDSEGKTHVFKAPDKDSLARWMAALDRVMKLNDMAAAAPSL